MGISIKVTKRCFNEVYFPQLNNYNKRYNVYYGGAGSGKSHFVVQKMILKLLKFPNRKCLVVRKVQSSIRDSIFALFKSMLGDWGLYDECTVNKTDLSIVFPNNSQIIFKGTDDPEKLKSIADISDIVCEEVTELEMDDFDQLDLRLRSREPHLQIHCMFNPVSKSSWVYKRWFENGYNEENTVVLHTTYKDNKFLPASYINTLNEMAKNNPVYHAIYALGEFATLDKLVYTNWKEDFFDYREVINLYDDAKAIFGLDFGYVNDPTAFIAAIISESQKTLWIFDEFFQKGLLNNEIAESIIAKGYGKEIITCDSAEAKSIAELKKHGLNRTRSAIKGKDSIMQGIQLLQQYRIIVHGDCTQIKEEFKNYTWVKDKKTGEYINRPVDKNNHGLDALRYAVQTDLKMQGATVRIFDRNSLF